MLGLLLVAVAQTPLPPVPVKFGQGQTVPVPVPRGLGADIPAVYHGTFPSPRGDAAVVEFCWEVSTMSPLLCPLKLVRADGEVTELKEGAVGAVGSVLWSADGRYVVGRGNNTVRLWNLSGGLRRAVPRPQDVPRNTMVQTHLTRLWWSGPDLCVALNSSFYDERTRQSTLSLTTTRYAVPSLKVLSVRSERAPVRGEVPCPPAQ